MSRSNRPKTAKYVTQMLFCFYSHERQASPGTSLTQPYIFPPKTRNRPANYGVRRRSDRFLPRIATCALLGTSYSLLRFTLVVNFKMQPQYVKKTLHLIFSLMQASTGTCRLHAEYANEKWLVYFQFNFRSGEKTRELPCFVSFSCFCGKKRYTRTISIM